ncbi:MAG: MFS transporter [Burkholderiales bacterium]
MRALILALSSLFAGIALLLLGVGLLFMVLGLRAGFAEFPVAVTGVIMSAYFAGFVFGTYACPHLVRRVGHIRAFAAMASVASATPVLHALLIEPWWWGFLRFVAGACLVGLYIVIESWLATLAPNSQRGRLFAIYMSVTLVAMACGQFLILAVDTLGFAPFALVSVLLSLALVPITLTRVAEPAPADAPRLRLARLYRVSPLGVAGALASGLLNATFYSMGAVFALRVGMSEAGTAAFMAATIFGGALLQWPIGALSDRYDRRSVLVAVCVGAATLAAFGFVIAHVSETALVVLAFFYGGLAFTVYGLSVAHVNDMVDRSEALETTGGLLLLHGIGAAVGPAAAGALMNALGPGSLLLFFAIVLGALGLFGVYRTWLFPDRPTERPAYVPMSDASPAVLRMDPRTPDRA